jgi:hypothetical protein
VLRRDSRAFVLLRLGRSALARGSERSVWAQHAHLSWSPVTRLQVTNHLFPFTTVRAGTALSFRDRLSSTHTRLVSTHRDVTRAASTMHTRTLLQRHQLRAETRVERHTDRLERRLHKSVVLKTLAREISARLTRVEQLPARPASIAAGRAAPALPMPVVRRVSPPLSPAPPAAAAPHSTASEPPLAPALNVEALTQTVMRQIDSRLAARRERLG